MDEELAIGHFSDSGDLKILNSEACSFDIKKMNKEKPCHSFNWYIHEVLGAVDVPWRKL